ncbi:MAG: alpha/beta hydrolase [Bacteroidota bacterium]
MYALYLLLLAPIGYGLLYWLVPKGNLLHEVVQLPVYLVKTLRVDVSNMQEEKHRYGKHFRQYLLHFHPTPGTPERQQIIVYLHGGGWQFGKPEMFRANAKIFTERGYHVFAISYRRVPLNNYQDIRSDMLRGMQHLLALRERHQLMSKKICFGGMSAGAHLVAMLLYDREQLQQLGLTQADISGIFLCGAPLDLRQMQWTPTLRILAGPEESDTFKAANPIEFLQADEQTPVLAFHATRDGLVRYPAGAVFLDRLATINPEIVEFHTLQDQIHLDSGTWVMEDNWIRKRLISWLEEREVALSS